MSNLHSLLVISLLTVVVFDHLVSKNGRTKSADELKDIGVGGFFSKIWRGFSFNSNRWMLIGGRRHVKIHSSNSIVVFGPTRCGKTTYVLVPILCDFDGSAVVTSVKNDVYLKSCTTRGLKTKVLAISEYAGDQSWCWDPVDYAKNVPEAREVAHHMVISSGEYRNSSGDSKFWYRLAEPLLAGVLLASSTTETIEERKALCSFDDIDLLFNRLDFVGADDLSQSILAVLRNDERHASSVLITAQSVLNPHLQALELFKDASFKLDLNQILRSRWTQPFTLYLIASLSTQSRLAPYFGTIVSLVGATLMKEEYRTSNVLFALDELANVAPVSDLMKFASAGLAFGLQMVSVFQDFSQTRNIYGDSAGTVINNHGSKIFFGGISDPSTLELFRSVLSSTEQADSNRRLEISHIRRGEAVICEPFTPPSKVRLERRSSLKLRKKFTFG